MAASQEIKEIINQLDAEYGGASPSRSAAPSTTIPGVDFNLLDREYSGSGETPTSAPSGNNEWWQGFKDDLSWLGTGTKLGVGFARGVKDVIDTGAHGLARAASFIGDRILPENAASALRANVATTINEDRQGRDDYNREYPAETGILPNASSVGRFGGEVAATIPLMPTRLLQGVRAGMGALPTVGVSGGRIAAPLANRLGAASAQGAIGGAVFNAATSSANDKSLAENVGEGLITGAIGGPVIAGAGAIAKSVGSGIVGRVSQRTAELAQRAEDLGIPLKATQVSSSPTIKKYDQISGMLPFSGAQNITENQANSFTRAISRTFGENTHEITPELIQSARRRIGTDIERVGANSTIRADQDLGNALRTIVRDAHGTVAEGELRPIVTQIQNILNKIDNSGNISGEAYLGLTNYKAMLSKAQNSANPNIRTHANEIRNALDDALERSISPSQRETLLAARARYKAVMTIKDLAEGDPGGHISPMRLMQKVIRSPGGKLYSGELGEIADIGRKFFPQPADSGTPLGSAILDRITPFVHSPITAAATAGGAALKGATYLDLGLGAAALGVNRLVRNALNSNTVRRSIIDRGLSNTQGVTNDLTNRLAPYAVPILEKPRDPLRITVTPNDREPR